MDHIENVSHEFRMNDEEYHTLRMLVGLGIETGVVPKEKVADVAKAFGFQVVATKDEIVEKTNPGPLMALTSGLFYKILRDEYRAKDGTFPSLGTIEHG